MKKTLITLVALAGVATANSDNLLWTLDCTQGQYDITMGAAWTGNPYQPNTSYDFSADSTFTTRPGYAYVNGTDKISMEEAYIGVKLADSFTISMNCSLTGVGSTTQTSTTQTSFTLLEVSESLTWEFGVMYNTITSTVTLSANPGTYTLSNVTSHGTYDYTDISNVTLTMSGGVNEVGKVSVYINGQLASTATMAADNRHKNSNVNHGLTFLQKRDHSDGRFGFIGGVSSVSLYNAVTVPEPTTATLSLLALIGLAMHRKRK